MLGTSTFAWVIFLSLSQIEIQLLLRTGVSGHMGREQVFPSLVKGPSGSKALNGGLQARQDHCPIVFLLGPFVL